MIVNNFDKIEKMLNFDKAGDYYFVQIFKRRKENPDLEYHEKRIKCFCIYSMEDFYELFPKIKWYCSENNARAYIRLNKQNSLDVSLRCISEISENIRKGMPFKNEKIWYSVSGQKGAKDFWMLDIDSEHFEQNPYITNLLTRLLIEWYSKHIPNKGFIKFLETKSGAHLICKPFNPNILGDIQKSYALKGIQKIQIQKDCNTLLYYESI